MPDYLITPGSPIEQAIRSILQGIYDSLLQAEEDKKQLFIFSPSHWQVRRGELVSLAMPQAYARYLEKRLSITSTFPSSLQEGTLEANIERRAENDTEESFFRFHIFCRRTLEPAVSLPGTGSANLTQALLDEFNAQLTPTTPETRTFKWLTSLPAKPPLSLGPR